MFNSDSDRINKSYNQVCDICLCAKHPWESFPISKTKTFDIFQLIHCDLWGPYRTPTFCGARYFW